MSLKEKKKNSYIVVVVGVSSLKIAEYEKHIQIFSAWFCVCCSYVFFLPFYPGGLFFGRVFQAVHGRGVHKIAQVGAGSRASSIFSFERRRLRLLLLFHPFDDSDSVSFRNFNAAHRSTTTTIGFDDPDAVIPTTDHSGHSLCRPMIIITVSVAMDEKRIDLMSRWFVHHPSLSVRKKCFFVFFFTPSHWNAETIAGSYLWMDGCIRVLALFYQFFGRLLRYERCGNCAIANLNIHSLSIISDSQKVGQLRSK